jgi:hypothetical protein
MKYKVLSLDMRVFQLILQNKKKNGAAPWLLYTFYQDIAQEQQTPHPRVTVSDVTLGLGWSVDRVRSAKRTLRELGVIEDTIAKNTNGKITGHYIRFLTLPVLS